MEKNSSSKKKSSSCSSTSMSDLFGPKDSLPSSPSSYSKHSSSSDSSSTIFGSVFGPSSMGGRSDQTGKFKHSASDNWSPNNKDASGNNSYNYEQETIDCHFSSSIFYGSREVYTPTTRSTDSHFAGGSRDSTSQTGMFRHNSDIWSPPNNKDESGNNSHNYEQETTDQPCHFSSSIYYGSREVYTPTTRSADSHSAVKKDEKEDDPNTASRGNWWQGSLYY